VETVNPLFGTEVSPNTHRTNNKTTAHALFYIQEYI